VEREESIPYEKIPLYIEMENLEPLFCELINYTMVLNIYICTVLFYDNTILAELFCNVTEFNTFQRAAYIIDLGE